MINTANIPKAYSEVYEFINCLGEDYINKIPTKIYHTIKNNRDISYKPTYDKNQKLDETMISKEAIALITAFNLQYWCNDETTKTELKQSYIKNTQLEEQKYSYDNLFKKPPTKIDEITEQECKQTQLIEYNQESIFTKLMNKLRFIFSKIKKNKR